MRPISVAVFIEESGKILFVRQREAKGGGWGPPAGHLEPGELITQAAKREVREETGLEVELVDIVGIYNIQEPGRLKVGFVFHGRVIGGKLESATQEAAELALFTKEEVLAIRDSGRLYKPEYNLQGIVDFLDGESYPLTLLKESA